MLLKLQFLFISCIICSFALKVTAGRTDIKLNGVEDIKTGAKAVPEGQNDITDIKLEAVEDTTTGAKAVPTGWNDIADIKFEADENAPANETSARANDNCGWKYGCLRGYCWSNCRGGIGVLVFDGDGPEWCWQTKTFSQSYQYISCTSNDECGHCYACGGPCSV